MAREINNAAMFPLLSDCHCCCQNNAQCIPATVNHNTLVFNVIALYIIACFDSLCCFFLLLLLFFFLSTLC